MLVKFSMLVICAIARSSVYSHDIIHCNRKNKLEYIFSYFLRSFFSTQSHAYAHVFTIWGTSLEQARTIIANPMLATQ